MKKNFAGEEDLREKCPGWKVKSQIEDKQKTEHSLRRGAKYGWKDQ